jgi:hypothetical protein
MDTNHYALECYVRDRLMRARDEVRAAHLLHALRPIRPRRRLRGVLGGALIALGQWLVEATPAPNGTHA